MRCTGRPGTSFTSTAACQLAGNGSTHLRAELYATVMVHPTPGKLCAGDLYIATSGRDSYIRYELSGGP